LFVGLGLSSQEVTTTSMEVKENLGAKTQAGDWLIRLRATGVIPNTSSTIEAIGGQADVSGAAIPELDFTYFITNRFAVELILGTSKHDVRALGTAVGDLNLGEIRVLPPTLTFQYHHPALQGKIKPYLGAGVNYTVFYDAEAGPGLNSVDYDNSFGFAAQAGMDIFASDKYFLNFDVKKIWLNTNVTVDATDALGAVVGADVDLDPWVVSFGIGRKF
ncbi:MAG: OmpW/AlkL family protein, partial [Flavobacteriales bacterium]